jgi:hypothetical protein
MFLGIPKEITFFDKDFAGVALGEVEHSKGELMAADLIYFLFTLHHNILNLQQQIK